MAEPIYAAGQATPAKQGPHTVGSHIAETDTVIKRINELMVQLTRAADHLSGMQPTVAANFEDVPEPPAGSINLKFSASVTGTQQDCGFCV